MAEGIFMKSSKKYLIFNIFRCLILHLSLPGQFPNSEKMKTGFPTFHDIGLNLVTVLDQLRKR